MRAFVFLFVLLVARSSAEDIDLDDYFSKTTLFERPAPWKLTKLEEEHVLERLSSEERKIVDLYLQYIRKYQVNTPDIRERLIEFLEPKHHEWFVIDGDIGTSISVQSSDTLEKLYNVSTDRTFDVETKVRQLKSQLNTLPDFEERFTEELAKREESERKPFERSDSSSETSTGMQSVDTPQKSSIDNPRSFAWLYWILSVLILSSVGVLAWNSRKGSSAS